jgi:hypothetical protein
MAALRADLIAALCRKPCRAAITVSQRRLMPDGGVEITGEVPPPLCSGCPERSNPRAPIRHLEVRFETEPGGGIGDLVDTESTPGENITIINVLYDDPRSAHPGL